MLFSVDYNYSLESKYGDSDLVKFSEHIIDVNTSFDVSGIKYGIHDVSEDVTGYLNHHIPHL